MTRMMTNSINTLTISDLHLGLKPLTASTIEGLDKIFPDNVSIASIDMLIIAGDVFDNTLSLPDDDVMLIQNWMHHTAYKCAKWGIILVVLEGTPSHDRKQSKQFLILNEHLKKKAAILYIDTLCIEYIPKLDINILFVPDEWRGDSSQTQLEVVQLLKERNLRSVDYSIMHGCFEFQLPPQARNSSTHSFEFYSQITDRYVFIGHHHVPTARGNVLVQGSFNRLRFGEEENKGYYYVESYLDKGLDVVRFKVNELACLFKTINIVGLTKEQTEKTLHDTVRYLESINNNYNIPTNIKVVLSKNDSNEDVVLSYKKSFFRIKWVIELAKVKAEVGTFTPKVFIPTPINCNTILNLVEKRILCLDISSDTIVDCLNVLNDLKNKVKV